MSKKVKLDKNKITYTGTGFKAVVSKETIQDLRTQVLDDINSRYDRSINHDSVRKEQYIYKLERALEVALTYIKNETKEMGDYWTEGEDALKKIKTIMEGK
jgi:hypothetical protein